MANTKKKDMTNRPCLSSWKSRLKSIFLNGEKCRPQGGLPSARPAQRVAAGKEGVRERANDVFFASVIKRRRSKADFAPTWSR